MSEALPSKRCFKCGEVKILSDFYKHPMMADGHVNKCKECNKKDVHKNRADNIDYVREYDRTRRKKENVTDERWEELSTKRKAYSDAYYEANPEKWEEKLAKYRKENMIAEEWEEHLACGRKDAFTPGRWLEFAAKRRAWYEDYYNKNPDKWEDHIARSRKENCTDEEWRAICESKRKYAEANPEKLSDIRQKYKEKYPKKARAHQLVNMAYKTGKLVKQPCEVCGNAEVHAHHPDYDKPLDVMWLCAEHHSLWHREHGEGLNGT